MRAKPLCSIPFWNSTASPFASPLNPRATNVAPAASAREMGLIGFSITPSGVDFVPISARGDHRELRVRELDPGRDRDRTSVNRVEAVRRQEVRDVRRASNPAHDRDRPRLELEGLERLLEPVQDGEIAAPRTPRRLDLGLVLLQLDRALRHVITSRIFAEISLG